MELGWADGSRSIPAARGLDGDGWGLDATEGSVVGTGPTGNEPCWRRELRDGMARLGAKNVCLSPYVYEYVLVSCHDRLLPRYGLRMHCVLNRALVPIVKLVMSMAGA